MFPWIGLFWPLRRPTICRAVPSRSGALRPGGRASAPKILLWLAVAGLGTAHSAKAGPVSLNDLQSHFDGLVSSAVPVGSAWDSGTGLGTFTAQFLGAGTHSALLFVDHELSEAANGFDNELGAVTGAPSAGQSWEIDEPGFSANPGDIYDHFTTGQLDNVVGRSTPDDVSMALGWDFVLQPRERGLLTFLVGTQPPTSPFYLVQSDPESGEKVYFSSSLAIASVGVPDHDAAVPWLGLSAVVMAAWFRRRDPGPSRIS